MARDGATSSSAAEVRRTGRDQVADPAPTGPIREANTSSVTPSDCCQYATIAPSGATVVRRFEKLAPRATISTGAAEAKPAAVVARLYSPEITVLSGLVLTWVNRTSMRPAPSLPRAIDVTLPPAGRPLM